MALLFFDSCGDHYGSATSSAKWTPGIGSGTVGSNGRNSTQHLAATNIRKIFGAYDAPSVSGSTVIFGLALRMSTLASAVDVARVVLDETTQIKLTVNTNGTLDITRGSSTVLGTTTFAIVINAYYYVEVRVLLHASAGTIEIRVDGDEKLSMTGLDTMEAATPDWNGFGIAISNGIVDDVYVCDGSGPAPWNTFLGDARAEALIAQAGNGTHTGLTPSTGTDHGALVDDATPDGDTTYNGSATEGVRDTYTFPSMVGLDNVLGVQILGYARKTDAVRRAVETQMLLGGTVYDGPVTDLGQDFYFVRQLYPVNPATGLRWTAADVNAIEAGLRVATIDAPTRWYLQNRAAPYTPATVRGAWDFTTGHVVMTLDPSKPGGGFRTSKQVAETNASTEYDVLLGRWVSGPLAAQTISGTIDVCLGAMEGDPAGDMHWHLHIYVTQGDSDTPRGTLLNDYRESAGVNEWPTTGAFIALNAAAALSSLAISAGDRIVIELGYSARNALTDSLSGTIRYGTLVNVNFTVPMADGVLGQTDSDVKAGYVDFSVGLEPHTVAARLSQMVVEVLTTSAYTPPVLQKVTQQVIQVAIDEIADVDPPVVADACTGGGTVPTGTNPSAGTSLANATRPEFWVEIDMGGASPVTLRVARGPLAHSDSYKEPGLISIGDVVRAATDERGELETAEVQVTLADAYRTLRDAMDEVWDGSSVTDAFIDRHARVYVRDEVLGGTAQLVFQGTISHYRPEPDLSATFVIRDRLNSIITTADAEEMLVPKTLMNPVTDNNPVERMYDKPIPLAYGSLSDEALGDDAVGAVPAHYTQQTSGFVPDLPGAIDFYIVCLGAVKNIQSVFGANYISGGDEPTSRIKLPPGFWGTYGWHPHHASWPFGDKWVEVGGKRYTAILLDQSHPVSIMARTGRVPLTVNLCGYEDVGDGTGTMIDSIERQLLHFLINFVWGDYDGTGDWATSIPALGSYSAADSASFEATKTAGAAMLAGGIKGASLIGYGLRQRPAREIIAQFCRSGMMDLLPNRFGQWALTRLDRTQTASAATVRTDLTEIARRSFRIRPRTDQRANIFPYVFGRNYVPALSDLAPTTGTRLPRDPYDGAWTSGLLEVTDGTGGTRPAETQELEMIRDETIAEWVMEQYRDLWQLSRMEAEWIERLGATDLEIGAVTKVTDYTGTGATGWNARRVQVRRHVLQPDPAWVKVTARDVDDQLA